MSCIKELLRVLPVTVLKLYVHLQRAPVTATEAPLAKKAKVEGMIIRT